jgi:hypothetical protein
MDALTINQMVVRAKELTYSEAPEAADLFEYEPTKLRIVF